MEKFEKVFEKYCRASADAGNTQEDTCMNWWKFHPKAVLAELTDTALHLNLKWGNNFYFKSPKRWWE